MGTYSAVACQEIHGTRQEQTGYSDRRVTVQLSVAWSLREDLANDLLGNCRADPYIPYLYARSVSIVPDKGQYTESGQSMTYNGAIATVEYGLPGGAGGGQDQPDPEDPTDLVSEIIEPTATFMTLDHKRFLWADGTELREDEAPGWLVRTTVLKRTLYFVPQLDPKLLEIGGTVNDRKYTSRLLDLEFEAETLLAESPKMSRTITTAGAKAWNLAMAWEYRSDGWNKYFRYTTGLWEHIHKRLTGGGLGAEFNSYPLLDQRPFLPG